MVQLAVFAADPDGQKQGLKEQQKKSWPIDESTMVELPLEDAPVTTVVEVKHTGCCTRKCALFLTVVGVLLAIAASGVALWVISARPSCLYGPKPQDDVVYPDEPDYGPEFPDYDSGDQDQHGGHHGGGHHGGHHDDDHNGHHGGHHSNPEGGDDHHDGWPIGGPHRPFPHHQ